MQPGVIPELVDKLHITPNGAMFAPPSVVPGVLPRLLAEVQHSGLFVRSLALAGADVRFPPPTQILDTRVMVKAALKSAPATARALQRSLTARQLGLKLIANVTYGAALLRPHRLLLRGC